ncbi:FUSC family protein [Novosphingobium profundi]|uniref:FUSC family protein n=1 Tax=Novosphingobium profundi TaxID=1774954 RepID=UPI001BDA2D1C|nr:FUSC family protein [Novosphingobium profundi]MBT0669152.1 FUSC family protein [Novosphingobium profundi]
MTSARWQACLFSAKTALAALMALWITLWVGLERPFWAMTTAYIVSSPLSGATRSKAIYRVLGTFVGAIVAVALVPVLVDWPPLLCLALALWVGATLAVSLLDRSPRAYTMMLAGYTAMLIAFPAVDTPEAVFDIATARVTEIVLGITCATLTHSLLWPRSVGANMGQRLSLWCRDARAWRDEILSSTSAKDLHDPQMGRRKLAQDAVDCVLLATHIPFDTSHWREANASVQAILRRILLLLPALSGLADRRRALLELDARSDASPQWRALLGHSHALREAQTAQMLDESEAILAHVEDRTRPTPVGPQENRATIALHADWRFAILAGLAAAASILICCAIWIGTGWADGAIAAMMTGVFCCLFAALDNPVTMILRFGAALIASLPLAAFYLFVLLPPVDGFIPLALLLLPVLLAAGWIIPHPRFGVIGVAFMLGFANALALQESFHANLARFINANSGQVLGVLIAAIVTAGMRTAGVDRVIARLRVSLHKDLVALASARSAPNPMAALGRTTDRLALISERLGDATDAAAASLREVRIAANIVAIQQLRAGAERKLALALSRVLRDVARTYRSNREDPPERLLARIDVALRLMLAAPEPARDRSDRSGEGLGALVALRCNLFPKAPDFRPDPRSAPLP